jgi:hypothetical protein
MNAVNAKGAEGRDARNDAGNTAFVLQASDPMILPSVAIAASIRGDQGMP